MRIVFASAACSLLLVATPVLAGPPSPQMPSGEFLQRAEPLLKKGMTAMLFSGEARSLARTLGRTADLHHSRLQADRAAGRAVTTCPPPKGKASIEAGEFLAFLRRLPPEEKAKSLDHAVGGYLARKWPCKT